MIDLGTILNLPVSLANGINNRGQVVGFSQDLDGSNTVAWVWQDGVMTDLNNLIPSGSPWFLIEALGINNRGEIAGYALNTSTGDVHGYVLTPVQGSENSEQAAQDSAKGRSPVVLPENVRQIVKHQMGLRYHIAGIGAPKH
jgi:probable HAF family extracellular repeat protein